MSHQVPPLAYDPSDEKPVTAKGVAPLTMAMGIKFVIVWEIKGCHWACFKGPSFLSDPEVLAKGDLVPSTLARELFPEMGQLKTCYGGVRFTKGVIENESLV